MSPSLITAAQEAVVRATRIARQADVIAAL